MGVDGEAIKQNLEIIVGAARDQLRPYQSALTDSDKALVMQGYNKALAFKTAYSEALLTFWRLMCCETSSEDDDDASLENGGESEFDKAMELVQFGKDPIAKALLERMFDAEELLMGLMDGAIRSLCPAHQSVQREAYRSMADEATLQRARGEDHVGPLLRLECETVQDYLQLFARCGIQPSHWVKFVEAAVLTAKTHTPYGQDDDFDDLDKSQDSAFARAIAQQISLPAIQAIYDLKILATLPLYAVSLTNFWNKFTDDDKAAVGEQFYRTLFEKHSDLIDYFSQTDMDSLPMHLMMSLDLVVKKVHSFGSPGGTTYRNILEHLGEIHRKMGVPTYSYALVGANLLDLECLKQAMVAEEEATKDSAFPVTPNDLRSALLKVYIEVMSIVYYPMLRQEKLIQRAHELYGHLKPELKWSDVDLEKRIVEIETEIAATGTYNQTSEELEIGMRLAWRNSAKCIGRIAWNTLKVRDCRHVSRPDQIFEEVQNHLKEATAGTNIQSVMTVFRPKGPKEAFGIKFWSSQLVRYAGYKDPENEGKVLGDPANAHLTEYLLSHNYWTPPKVRSAFDVLPLVLKVPHQKKPYVYELPREYIYEVCLAHPSRPEITNLGYRWTTVPAIADFNLTVGS